MTNFVAQAYPFYPPPVEGATHESINADIVIAVNEIKVILSKKGVFVLGRPKFCCQGEDGVSCEGFLFGMG